MVFTGRKVGTALTVGAVDIALTEAEARGMTAKIPGGKYLKNAVRFIEVIGGAIWNAFFAKNPWEFDVSETMVYSATPLAMHGARELVYQVAAKPTVVTVAPPVTTKAPAAPAAPAAPVF